MTVTAEIGKSGTECGRPDSAELAELLRGERVSGLCKGLHDTLGRGDLRRLGIRRLIENRQGKAVALRC